MKMAIALSSIVSALAVGLIAATSPASFAGTQPQLASLAGRVFLAFGRGDAISVARSDDGGRTFGTPAVLKPSGKVYLGMHRGPRIAATDAVVLVSIVAGAKGGGADGDVLLYRSQDFGRSWTGPVAINNAKGSAREGLHALAASPSGLVVSAWLDLRAGGTRVYAAVSRDHGATWAPDALVYASPSGSVCECCHPSVSIDDRDQVAVMFRNSVEGNRDMYVARLTADGSFSKATKLGTASWRLNACPMDGGSLAAGDKGPVAVWRREDGIFLGGEQAAERRLGTGRDPAIAIAGTNQDVVWSSATDVWLIRGSASPTLVAPGRFPAIISLKDRTMVAWEHDGRVLIQAFPR